MLISSMFSRKPIGKRNRTLFGHRGDHGGSKRINEATLETFDKSQNPLLVFCSQDHVLQIYPQDSQTHRTWNGMLIHHVCEFQTFQFTKAKSGDSLGLWF